MTHYLTITLLLLLVLYGMVEAWPLITGPKISVVVPADNATIPDGMLMVTGQVKNSALLTLNGAPLLHDQRGDFSSTLTFPRGGSILTFVVVDRFGRSTTATRTIFVP